jgi:integrase
VWCIRYVLPGGTIKRESAKTTSKKEAEAFLERRKVEARDGKIPTRPARLYTFNDLADVYYRNWAGEHKSLKERRCRIKQLTAEFGNLPLSAFDTKVVKLFKAERLKVNKAATVNRMLALLKHMFREAVEDEMVSEEVLYKIRKVKLVAENNRRLRYLSREECQTLIEACSPHLKPIVITALNTGMRKGGILSLKWEQIDLKHGFVLLNVTKNGERREIPINSTFRAILEAIPHGPESEYVFTDRNGRPFKEVKKSFETARRRAGILDFRFHDLRHTFASHLVMAGIDITTVKELLGHKTLVMTLRYAHLAPSHKVKAMEALEERLGSKNIDVLVHQLTQFGGVGRNASHKSL